MQILIINPDQSSKSLAIFTIKPILNYTSDNGVFSIEELK